MSRTWARTRPNELGAEWEGDDAPKGFTMTIAVDMDRESFLWAVVWQPPVKFATSWNEKREDGQEFRHEAIRAIREHGKELTREDAIEECEKALERIKPKVAALKLEELNPPTKAPPKAKRR
jgi:hypothetical protein